MAIKISLLFLLFVSAACSTVKIAGTEFHLKRERLKNGLVVLLVEDHSVPVVSYTTWVRVGSAWEKANSTGIAHLFEHLMFKGTPRYSGHAFFDKLESQGAQLNAYTQRDVTVYYETLSSSNLELVIDMESDRLMNLIINNEQLETEKKVVLEERRMRVDSDFNAQQLEELHAIAFSQHPYSVPVIGFEEDIRAITVDQCKQFFSTYYQPGNMVITVSGDIDTGKVLDLIRNKYGKIPGKKIEAPQLEPAPQLTGERRKTIYRPVESESLIIGYRIPSMHHQDIPALSTLSAALFGLGSSRARERIVREKQLAVNVDAKVDMATYSSLLYVSADLRKGFPVERVQAEIDQIISEIKEKPLEIEELNRVKKQLEVALLSESISAFGIASLMTFGEYYFGEASAALKQFDSISKVSVADLLRVARVYLKNDNRVVVYMKPLAGAKL